MSGDYLGSKVSCPVRDTTKQTKLKQLFPQNRMMTLEAPLVLSDLIPASVGIFATLTTNVYVMLKFTIMRFGGKEYTAENFVTVYKPWEHKSERWYRAFRAGENVKEWSIVVMPLFGSLSLIGRYLPYVGDYAGSMSVALSLIYNYYTVRYTNGYIESEKERVPGFVGRKNVFIAGWVLNFAAFACFFLK